MVPADLHPRPSALGPDTAGAAPGFPAPSVSPALPPKGRFAPSPSGRMHLGNALCALLAWLFARSQGGTIVLRTEDLDPQRCRMEYALQIEEDFRWLGLDWDEGGSQAGKATAYFQSRRAGFYESCLALLREKAEIYPCFCTRAELHAAQAPHASDGRFLYSGRCYRLSGEERKALLKARNPALRIHVPEEKVFFQDGLLGLCGEDLAAECGDFILRRSDGVFAYQLACACDDGAMGVTQVVRGRDLLSSTPQQIYLLRLLGYPPPRYYHIPLLLSPDGIRLSKRDKALDLGELRRGYSPRELIGLLAFLCGLLPQPEPASPQELLSVFDPANIKREDIRLPASLYEG